MTQLKKRLNAKSLVLFCAGVVCSASPAIAGEDFFKWHSANMQLLRGADYKLGSEERSIMTVEYANEFKYGDFFVFADQTWPDDGKPGYYIEPSLRFSMSKMTGLDWSYGMVKDVLISTNFEKPKGKKMRQLGGVAVDLDLPGFKFFKTNLYLRNDPDLSGNTYQFTTVWNRPFEVGGMKFLTEGFADLAGSEGTTTSHQLIVPRVLMDVGHAAGMQENKLWAGLEWQYWHNKFGVEGVTESVPQLQVKWVF